MLLYLPCIYFVQAVDEYGPIKIGFSTDPRRRFVGIQADHYQQLFLIGVIPNASASDERELHKRFSHSRIRGEWYKPTHELLALMHSSQHIDDVLTPLGQMSLEAALSGNKHAAAAMGWNRKRRKAKPSTRSD